MCMHATSAGAKGGQAMAQASSRITTSEERSDARGRLFAMLWSSSEVTSLALYASNSSRLPLYTIRKCAQVR